MNNETLIKILSMPENAPLTSSEWQSFITTFPVHPALLEEVGDNPLAKHVQYAIEHPVSTLGLNTFKYYLFTALMDEEDEVFSISLWYSLYACKDDLTDFAPVPLEGKDLELASRMLIEMAEKA